MNIRRVEVLADGAGITLLLHTGHASEPVLQCYEIDPATALVASSKLEAAAHRVCPAGLPDLSDLSIPNPS